MTELALLGHSAVQLLNNDQTLLIDPGVFSDLSAMAGATAVLISHGHADHVAASALASASAAIFAPQDVIDQLGQAGIAAERLYPTSPGDEFSAAGFIVSVHGGQHAEIYPGLPPATNNAYLIDGRILHPGDSLVSPADVTVDVVLLPIAAPWLKLADAISYARGFVGATVLPIHDAVLSDAGKQLTDTVLTAILGADTYRRPGPGDTVSA